MFDNIAPTYDTLNHRLSWNIDKLWRRKAIDAMRPYSPKRVLDIATGTGDFALTAASTQSQQPSAYATSRTWNRGSVRCSECSEWAVC